MLARMTSLVVVLLATVLAGWAPAQEKKAKEEEPHTKATADSKAKEEHPEGAKAEHAEHHDLTDLSHANMTSSVTNPIAFKSDMAIFTFVVFVLLVAILTKFAWKPIAHGLELREKGIAENIEQARIAAEQAKAQLEQYEARLAAATAEAQQIVAQARQDADAAGQKLIAEAQVAAAKERERAVADIGAAKNQALQEIAERSVDTAVTLARNIIRREVRPADHEQLIQDALKQFPSAGNAN
jgi:F-type H+-transporting ATPase subunit b